MTRAEVRDTRINRMQAIRKNMWVALSVQFQNDQLVYDVVLFGLGKVCHGLPYGRIDRKGIGILFGVGVDYQIDSLFGHGVHLD